MLYEITVPPFIKALGNLKTFLEKGNQFAETKKFSVENLLNARLAPDQFSLTRQVQIACDTAKLGVARLTGKNAPPFEDTEKTLPELYARIDKTVAYLNTVTPEDFAGADTRRVSTPRWEGKSLSGTEYALHHAIPNFYFHLATAYAILRHNGVDLGKKDYLGDLPLK